MEKEENYCTLYLVRHGQTEYNANKINMGQSDSALTEKGLGQVRETAKQLRGVKFDAVFSSDLGRAHKSAEILKLDRKLLIQTSETLRERKSGSFEKKPKDLMENELKETLEKYEKLSEEEKWSFEIAPDIETDESIVTRFMTKLREIAVAYRGQNVLVVSHAGPIKTFLWKVGYVTRKGLPSGSFKHGGYIKVLSDGVGFFVKEAPGIRKSDKGE